MNIFKKIFKVVIIILGIVLFFKLLGMVVFESHKNKSSELIDFKPTESLKIKTSTPIFYYSDKKLFYSKNGEINLTNHIWKGEINERYYENKVFVSPNSNFIAFDNNGSIKVLNKKGDILKNIESVSTDMLNGRKSGNFWNSDFQWSKNSENLYLMQDRVWEGNFNRAKNKSSLYKISTKTTELTKVIDLKEQSENFYLDSNESNLYFTAYDSINDEWLLKKLNLTTQKVIDTIEQNENWKLTTRDSIFINFKTSPGDIKLGKTIGESKKDTLCSIYLTENSNEKLIFKGKCGYNAFKGYNVGFFETNFDLFLPNNRYFLSKMRVNEKDGTIIIDSESLKYRFYNRDIKPFFSVTKLSYENVSYRSGEFIRDENIIRLE